MNARVYAASSRCQLGGRAAHKSDKFTSARIIRHGEFFRLARLPLIFRLLPAYAKWNTSLRSDISEAELKVTRTYPADFRARISVDLNYY